MKKGWQTENLGDLCQIIGGGTPSKGMAKYYSGNIPWATVRDMRSEVITETECKITKEAVKSSSTNIIPSGNVVIATRVGLGKVCLLGQDTAINQDLRGIVPIDQKVLSIRFLFWWLKSIANLIVDEGTGATVQGVKLPFVKSLQVPLPLFPEQQRIVRIVDKAFEGIAIAKANTEKNLQNARAVFESYLEDVFSKRGEGWIDAKLGDVCKKITDGTHITPKYTKEGVPFLSVKNLTKGFIDFSDTRFISPNEHAFLIRTYKPMRDDILYTKVGTTGIAKVIDVDEEFSIFVSVALLKPKHEIIFNSYLENFLNAPYAREQARKRTRGTANKNLVITDIKEIDIHFPKDLNEQHSIVNKIDALRTETQHLGTVYDNKLDVLDELKKSLLHQAFNGEL